MALIDRYGLNTDPTHPAPSEGKITALPPLTLPGQSQGRDVRNRSLCALLDEVS